LKKTPVKYLADLFFGKRLYMALTLCSLFFLLRYFIRWLGVLPYVATGTVICLWVFDYLFLFFAKGGLFVSRTHAERFSNGDENPVRLDVESYYNQPLTVEIIDEIPDQFQRRDVLFTFPLAARDKKAIHYVLRPVKRGEYQFGAIHAYVSGPIRFVKRRFQFQQHTTVPVYPSYMQMRQYQLMAIHNRLSEIGIKKVRRIGHSMEFEQIKEYVGGDDYRTVNWKATAKKGQLMVNHYTDERSQQIYCIIDKGRGMKMPFEGLSLLDYAINASLVLCNVALLKQDKAGVITFSERLGAVLAADKKATQMQSVLEILYNEKTRYLESDFELLYAHLRSRVKQRSLLVVFTNFESLTGLQRQLPYLRRIAQHHLLLVVFFENTELRALTNKPVNDVQKYGILSILTAPQNLTINTVNKYLELKARQVI
jgi:uncharacterized protein (DUF58 family)